jgi:hypothetical protein
VCRAGRKIPGPPGPQGLLGGLKLPGSPGLPKSSPFEVNLCGFILTKLTRMRPPKGEKGEKERSGGCSGTPRAALAGLGAAFHEKSREGVYKYKSKAGVTGIEPETAIEEIAASPNTPRSRLCDHFTNYTFQRIPYTQGDQHSDTQA